ncbi:MAG: hypothetical protein JWM80_3645 [Cyanobacteria bacterium RYN_339]|nr:hypothetical protein [Cyanobacteria bacterium RYN_339]
MLKPSFYRSALAIALLPALAACGKTPATTTHVATKKFVAASTAPSVTKINLGEGVPASYPSLDPAPRPSSAAPTAAPSDAPVGPGTVSVSGYVFDESGAVVEGATVTARSLDSRAPFDGSATTQGGAYLLKGVPEGVGIELIATKANWTTRRRVRAFATALPEWNRADFGATNGDDGADGAAAFISNRPEIVSATFNSDFTAVTLKLSEALDTANRARLERALRVLPANAVATAGVAGAATDLRDVGLAYPVLQAVDDQAGVDAYDVREGSVFLSDTAHAAGCTWDNYNTQLTLSFPFPLQADRDHPGAYQLALVSAGVDQSVRDTDGNLLGTDGNGKTDGYPDAGQLVPAAIYNASGAARAVSGLTGSALRWATSHQDVVYGELKRADGGLALQEVHTASVGGNTRIELKFSRPMVAYDGTLKGFSSASLAGAEALAHFTFALGGTQADLAGLRLDRDAATVDPRTATSFGALDDMGVPFRFSADAFVADPVGAAAGSVALAIDPMDSTRVILTVVGRARFFNARASVVSARAVDVADPAGRKVADMLAEPTGVRGTI